MLKKFIGLYGILAGLASLGLAKIKRQGHGYTDEELPTIAVIVAARNEQANLPDLIASLAAQNYPDDKVSFWIVDDESTDGTLKIAKRAAERHPRFHALPTDKNSPISSPKKRAIDTGIRACHADWIVTTDADCMPRPGWLRALASFMGPDIGIVLGYSPLVGGKDPIEWISMGESWSSAALCSAAVGLGFPFNAFGRNFAFRRKIFLDMGGYGKDGSIASGDDDLFLQRVTAKTDWRAAFAADPRAFVPSKVVPAKKMYKTKARHMSVGPKYAPGWVVIGFLGNVLFMGLALATLLARLGIVNRKSVSRAWKAKWFFDAVLAASAVRVLGDPLRAGLALGAMTVAPFALWAIWPKALFGTVDWKGRSFARNNADSFTSDEDSEPVSE